MTQLILVTLFMVAAAHPVAAQDAADGCTDPTSQSGMNRCADMALSAADDALNDAYRRATATMRAIDTDLPEADRGAAKALLTAQRAWISYRDAACDAEGFLVRGGSMEPLTVLQCRLRLTEARTADLADLLRTY